MAAADRLDHLDLRDRGLAWRALVAMAAIVAAAAGAPSYVVGVLVTLALLSSVQRLVRGGRGGLDSLLLLVGGVLVALVLTGALLGSTSIGLTTRSWGIGLGVVSLGLVAAAALRPRPDPLTRPDWLVAAKALPWAVAVIAVVALAVTGSVRSMDRADAAAEAKAVAAVRAGEGAGRAPVQMSLGTVKGGQVQVVVSSAKRLGPVELRTTSVDGDEIDYPLFTVAAGTPYKSVVAIPVEGRFVVSLVDPDRMRPLRSLVVDR